MSTASTESDHGDDAALDDPGDDAIEAADLLDDPRTDAEALCLCSLLWSPAAAARTITTALTADDFYRPLYAELFTVIAEQVEADAPHDPASIAAALTQAGKTAGHRGTQLARALTQAVMAGSPPEAVGHYAITVASAAYRRGFHTAAAALTQAAEQLPQDQLFAHLVSIGRAQRAATERLQTMTDTLTGHRNGRPTSEG
jgi:replicative DNA helicase